jgi:quercetin dioxygenase-like cupin family protein
MTEEKFGKRLRENGYGEEQHKEFAPNTDGPMDSHDFSVMLLVMSGEFTLAQPGGSTTYGPGECCELPAGAEHAERTGPSGARVPLGKK